MSRSAIWKEGISFGPPWKEVSIVELDAILPSWLSKRKELAANSTELTVFLNKLKRSHAIETGVIENLYYVSRGVTETMIERGIDEAYISQEDVEGVSKATLMDILKDQLDAIDTVFEFIKDERPMSLHFIRSLHAQVTVHQPTTTAIDSLGRTVQVPLVRGEWKKHNNNPSRLDQGVVSEHCPVEQVLSEMDRLIEIYSDLVASGISAVVQAAWFHHAFTTIHPFQDGNGRVARLLASFILIKGGLFPFTVIRDQKKDYLVALEQANRNEPQALVSFFVTQQIQSIGKGLELADLNQKPESIIIDLAAEKLNKIIRRDAEQNLIQQNKNLDDLFYITVEASRNFINKLSESFPKDIVISHEYVGPGEEEATNYYLQIVEYAKLHGYYFNSRRPRFWTSVRLVILNDKFDLIITGHAYGRSESAVAIGGFVDLKPKDSKVKNGVDGVIINAIPCALPPILLTLEKPLAENYLPTFKAALDGLLNSLLAAAVNQIN